MPNRKQPLEVIILAAGKGKRMHSDLPKVLHEVAGCPMLLRLLNTIRTLQPACVHIVIGHQAERVTATVTDSLNATEKGKRLLHKIRWVRQARQLGTGHAVMQALPGIAAGNRVLVLNGDTPLVSAKTLRRIINARGDLKLLTANLHDPSGMGRILRTESGDLLAIVEEADATPKQRKICEVNTNCLSANSGDLMNWLQGLCNRNAQGELYLTDALASAIARNATAKAIVTQTPNETLGVNSKPELARVERIFQRALAHELMAAGLQLMDPERFDLRGTCAFGSDCIVDVNAVFEGRVKFGSHVRIGANVVIRNSSIGDHCVIDANCVIDTAVIGSQCTIGPFARIRPQTRLEKGVKIGNFVETKKSHLGRHSKVNHLSYVGDSTVGANVNIGAGVITCNYDGANKHATKIGDDVFIGSNSQLIAPVNIASGATIGAGSTITDDVPRRALAVSRSQQRVIGEWRRPVKKQ